LPAAVAHIIHFDALINIIGGCVQEEIRFMINPECLVSMVLCEVMKENEAIIIIGIHHSSTSTTRSIVVCAAKAMPYAMSIGTEQFSSYRGYGFGLQFGGNFVDKTPRDAERIHTVVSYIIPIAHAFFHCQPSYIILL
jgi:hypothetical protein